MSAPECGSGRLQTAQQSEMTFHDQFRLLLKQHTHVSRGYECFWVNAISKAAKLPTP